MAVPRLCNCLAALVLLLAMKGTTAAPMTQQDRALAAIVGAFVGDAASMPLHWIYNTTKIKQMVGQNPPEFYSPPSCPYYNYTEGSFSPYGQQTLVFLSSLIEGNGTVPTILERNYNALYTIGVCGPDSGCYQDGSTKGFLANERAGKHYPYCGANDDQADAIAHMIPIVALMAGNKTMLPMLANMIRVTQNTERAVGFGLAAARILEHVILSGESGLNAVTAAIAEMKDPNRINPTSVDAALAEGLTKVMSELSRPNFDVVQEIGQSCDYPFNLWTGSHLIAQGYGYQNATSQTILAGGDVCSRNMFVGSINAALGGLDSIPAEWKQKTSQYDLVVALAKQLLGM
eukprot:m.299110 g.299110  ORF g.299110 m.299110 type:complete len:346 (+) comp14040_c0_seq1:2-1039(+)